MIAAPTPSDEAVRLHELSVLAILDSPPEPEFDDLADLARAIAQTPIALISLVDADRQWFKACLGLDVRETSRTVSFCAHALLGDGVMWVPDARRDIRFSDSPLVRGQPHIRFYAGAPILVRDSKIGTLCVIDTEPRAWDEGLAGHLSRMAKIVADRLIARQALHEHSIAIEAARDVIIRADRDGVVAAWNPAAEALTGRAAAEVIGKPISTVFRPLGEQEDGRDDRLYRLLVAEVDDYAIYMLDPHGRVVSWNAGARRIKGYEPGEIIGDHFSRFYTAEDQAVGLPAKALRQARTTGRFADEGWRVRKDGSQLWASVVIDAIYDNGEFVGFAKITRDVSERHEADALLKRALEQAEHANQAKSEFLANMSHEIRTPLNGVVGVADMLARSGLPPKQREMAEIVAASAKTLERLLGDILDLARIEAGQVAMAPERFDLLESIKSVSDLAQLKAEGQGLNFSFSHNLPRGAWVVADKLRIQQILTNLLSNAVKFTPSGEVSLTVRLTPNLDGSATSEFEVRDTGVGFDPAKTDLVFGRFSQADGSITRRFGGTGLGMAISKQLAQMMDARLDCDSEPGRGSVFILSVPVQTCDAAEETSETLPPLAGGAEDARPIRVLLVDDHPTNRKVCELILAQFDAEVTAAENGALALEAFDREAFDVVLMDIQMPVMDGLTAVRHIRERERAAGLVRTPVFMLTANALAEHVEQGRLAGADHHIAKPVTSAALFAALQLLAPATELERLENSQ